MIARVKAFFAFFKVPEDSQLGHCDCWPCCGNCEDSQTEAVSVNTAPITVLDLQSLQDQRAGLIDPS